MKEEIILKDKRLLLISFTGSVVLGILGFIVLPEISEYMQRHVNLQTLLGVCFFVVFLGVSAAVLGGITFRISQLEGQGRAGWGRYIYRLICFCLVAAGILVLVSLLDGVLALLLFRLLKNSLGYESIKLVIDLTISLVTILVMPVLVMQYITFTLGEGRFLKTVKAGLGALRRVYLKLLLALFSLFLLGWILMLAAEVMAWVWLKTIWMILCCGLLGTVSVQYIYRIGMKRVRRRVGKS